MANSNDNVYPSFCYDAHVILPQANPSALEEWGILVSAPKGKTLLEAGSIPDCCYLLKKGRVISRQSRAKPDEERIYHIYESGSLLFEENLLLSQPLLASYVALEKSLLLCIPRRTMFNLLSSDSHCAMIFLHSLSGKLLSTTAQLKDVSCHGVVWRTCNLFFSLADHMGVPFEGKLLIKEKLSQQILSEILGVNRVSIARTLKILREKGYIEVINGFYCLRNAAGLQDYMDSLE